MNSIELILRQQQELRRIARMDVEERVLSSSVPIYQSASQFIIVTGTVVKTEGTAFELVLESEDEVFSVNEGNSSPSRQNALGVTVYNNESVTLHNGTFSARPADARDRFFLRYLQVSIIERKRPEGLGGRRIISDRLPEYMNKESSWWKQHAPQVIFAADNRKIRQGVALPKEYLKKYSDPEFLKRYYKLRGFEYGRWTTQEDRLNFVSGMGLALYDLSNILGLSRAQMGLDGNLGIAFGSRGSGRANAHFEPFSYVINMRRQSREANDKRRVYRNEKGWLKRRSMADRRKDLSESYLGSGVRSFTHEFGHALDYYAGERLFGRIGTPLSHTMELGTDFSTGDLRKDTAEGAMQRLLFAICTSQGRSLGTAGQIGLDFGADVNEELSGNYEPSDYMARVIEASEGRLAYWGSKLELFARCFEVYVFVKLKDRGYFNVFLSKGKHSEGSGKLRNGFSRLFYPTENECRPLVPLFDDLIREMKKLITISQHEGDCPQYLD